MSKAQSRHTKPDADSSPSTPSAQPDPIAGPRNPPRPYARERLRRLLNLSAETDLDQLCESAAAEIERLGDRPQFRDR
jgi:hypothetical protein